MDSRQRSSTTLPRLLKLSYYLRTRTIGVYTMPEPSGYPAAYQAVVRAYAEAERAYYEVRWSNERTSDIAFAYVGLISTQDRFIENCENQFRGYTRHLRSVDECLEKIRHLDSSQANAARGALRRLRAAMQRAWLEQRPGVLNANVERTTAAPLRVQRMRLERW